VRSSLKRASTAKVPIPDRDCGENMLGAGGKQRGSRIGVHRAIISSRLKP
jgi:hypothetical protein